MQYCYLQHQTSLFLPGKSKTEHHFCFGWATSFFFGAISNCPLLLPQEHTGYLLTWGAHCLLSYLLPFYTVHGILTARVLEWFAILSSSGSHFVTTLHYDLCVLGGPAWHSSELHWVMQAPSPRQGSDPWKGLNIWNLKFLLRTLCLSQVSHFHWNSF